MHFWLYRKFIFQRKTLLEPTTLFSIMGISLGVAFLILSMAGFNGFVESLKGSIIDVSGDISVYKRGARISNVGEVEKMIKDASPQVREMLGFVNKEALVANEGELTAILLQGLDWKTVKTLKELERRKVSTIAENQEGLGEPAYLGKVVAKNLKLEVGESFRAIVLDVSKASSTKVSRQLQKFYVHSILDFGKYEFNQRMVLTRLSVVQKLARMENEINGFRIKVKNSDLAAAESEKIQEALGWDYTVRDWSMTNRSLFKAIRYEKNVLFFVMLIMVIAAFFNVSTTLFLGVLKRYSQISVMRALGLKKRAIVGLFCLHGLVLGVIGLGIGITLGLLFCKSFEWIQKIYPIMPEEVYKMSNFSASIDSADIAWVIAATLFICFVSTLAPAIHGSKLSPVEGLKYE